MPKVLSSNLVSFGIFKKMFLLKVFIVPLKNSSSFRFYFSDHFDIYICPI